MKEGSNPCKAFSLFDRNGVNFVDYRVLTNLIVALPQRNV